MTSAYDAVYDDDLPGFLFVKTQFWDRGQPDVEAYLRRRTIDGDLIWLVSKAVSYVQEPIPGTIVLESSVKDEERAKQINRITRITAILVQAVEASLLTGAPPKCTTNSNSDRAGRAQQQAPAVAVDGKVTTETDSDKLAAADAVAYKSILNELSSNGAVTEESLKNLMDYAAAGGGICDDGVESKLEQELKENVTGVSQKKKAYYDPWSMIESVRQGVRLDLGLTKLSLPEVKMVTLVLSGKLPAAEVAPLLLSAMKSGYSLKQALRQYRLDCENIRRTTSSSSGSPDRAVLNQAPIHIPHLVRPSVCPPISVVNVSYTYIGNAGMDMLCEVLYCDKSSLKTLDVSFCRIEERGLLALARALSKRKRKGLPSLRGLILSGNYISTRAATELGSSLAPSEGGSTSRRATSRRKHGKKRSAIPTGGFDSESESDEDEDDDDFSSLRKRKRSKKHSSSSKDTEDEDDGARQALEVLHVADTSMTAVSLSRLLAGLGPKSLIRELNLSSNRFGARGATELVKFLEGKGRMSKGSAPMPQLDRLDMSNNNLGDDGTTQLTRAISKRTMVHLVDLKLSSNSIGSGGIETIMNRLLHHNLVSLSLDKNAIGDQGCQLVAASLQSMTALSRLNLSFNQIGSRGITSLMRSLVVCDSITYLGLSGNILRISGAISLAFALAQHPRLEELDLDNCCLGQAAQCHITAGIISNRWVPMKRLRGYAVGPPMVAIGALKPYAQNLSNEECFRIRKDEQMKTILQWMENNRRAKNAGITVPGPDFAAVMNADPENRQYLSPDMVSNINDIHGTPSQNAYFRLLGWLSRIPFDDDELTALQKYFYDPDGGEGDRGSDGYINLKLRGDLLAALDSEVADEIRDELPSLAPNMRGSVGIDLDKLVQSSEWDSWEAFKGNIADPPQVLEVIEEEEEDKAEEMIPEETNADDAEETEPHASLESSNPGKSPKSSEHIAPASIKSLGHSDSAASTSGKEGRKTGKVKARITMFPQFEQQLEELKAAATEMIEQEEDPMQHEVILTQYAEASLTILRQLRYHCMNSGLDGWRQAGLKRKVLIIDDSNVIRKMVSRAFEKANFIVDTASNGAEGVEKMKASIYDIAFMDIDMPVMNGFEATKKLREWEDETRPGTRQPICALTAQYVDDFERHELMKFKEAGLDVMESKPCNIPRLFKVVDDVSPMFSDLSISVIQRERSDSSSRLSDL